MTELNEPNISYSYFCELFRKWKTNLVDDSHLILEKEPLQKLYIDWVGDTLKCVRGEESQQLLLLPYTSNVPLIVLSLFGFGLSFIFMQSNLVTTLQLMLPTMKGTVMSLTSFNIFFGAAVGTSVNAKILEVSSMNYVYLISAIIIAFVGNLSAIYVSKFEKAQVKEVKKKKFT